VLKDIVSEIVQGFVTLLNLPQLLPNNLAELLEKLPVTAGARVDGQVGRTSYRSLQRSAVELGQFYGRLTRQRELLEAAQDNDVRVANGLLLGLELAFLGLMVEAVLIEDDAISAGPAVLGLAFSLLVARHGGKRPQVVNMRRFGVGLCQAIGRGKMVNPGVVK
jgi:hypothetical protein